MDFSLPLTLDARAKARINAMTDGSIIATIITHHMKNTESQFVDR